MELWYTHRILQQQMHFDYEGKGVQKKDLHARCGTTIR